MNRKLRAGAESVTTVEAEPMSPLGQRVGRVVLVVTISAAAVWFTAIIANPEFFATDFHYYWYALRAWESGIDPYSIRPRAAWRPIWPLWDRLFYPLPALLVASPFAQVSLRAGHLAFIAVGTTALAWKLSKHATWPLLIFATPSFAMAARLGQWSPLLTLAAVVPSAGFLLACKPTLGLACFCYRPTWRAVASATAVLIVSLVVMPNWPREWLDNLGEVRAHPAPIVTAAGPFLILATLRWRQPEARLLLAMACVPQLLMFADQLPLFLVARTRREGWFYTLAGLIVAVIWVPRHYLQAGIVAMTAPYVLLGCYLPALWIVLRRPNEGQVPDWIERRVARWPLWLRGSSAMTSAVTG
jgi:hypothetical protein